MHSLVVTTVITLILYLSCIMKASVMADEYKEQREELGLQDCGLS